MDIHFTNIINDGGFEVNIDDMPPIAKGNQLIANMFEVTFLTNLNTSLMSFGYGGNGVDIISRSYDPNDTQSIAAAVKVACDNTVIVMQADQYADPAIPSTEKIVSAKVVSINKDRDRVSVSINIVPEQMDNGASSGALNLVIPL